MERLFLCNGRVFSCDARICVMYVNPREEHDIEYGDGYYGSCCSTRVSTLVEDMSNGANALHDIGSLFLWDVRPR
jgi:hypothetical protein